MMIMSFILFYKIKVRIGWWGNEVMPKKKHKKEVYYL